jgi:hypothetical protein
MNHATDPRVDAHLGPRPDWQRAICREVHDNKTARTVAVRPGEIINTPALTAMFQQIIANNRAGGWRKLTARS